MISIADADDARLDAFRSMRARESDSVLWAEGPTVVQRLVQSPLTVRSILLSPAAHGRLAQVMQSVSAPVYVPVYVAEQSVINRVVGFDLHRGAIAVADRPAATTLSEVMQSVPATARLLVLEGVNDAENLGAIIRSARALGADAVILDPTCVDPWYRRVVRVSMGEVFHLPIARAELGTVFDRLADDQFHVWALTPRPDAQTIGSLTSPRAPARLALVFGAEGPGLSDAVLGRHRNVRIPVRADVDSLNVGHAVAAALAVVQSSTV